jgi:roadblock/LC7 domain-containing protein
MANWIKTCPQTVEWSSLIQTLEGHSDSVTAVVFSPDGKLVASASSDLTVRQRDASMGATTCTFITSSTSTLAFSKDSQYLVIDRLFLQINGYLQGPPRNHNATLFVKDNWITYGKRKLLWLPREHRPSRTAVRKNLVALGFPCGEVQVVEFTLEATRRSLVTPL